MSAHSTYLVFGDLHGRVLPAFALAAAWQREAGEPVAALLQVGDDVLIGLLGELAGSREAFGHDAAQINRLGEEHAEVLAFGEVLGAERRRDVDDAGAIVH